MEIYTLSQAVDKYFISRGIDKKKHFSSYLTVAGDVYSSLFRGILGITKRVWQPVKSGLSGFEYIEIPCDAERVLAIHAPDDCGGTVPLYYNTKMPVVHKPEVSSCGCSKCQCSSGLCGELNTVTLGTKKLFSLNGVDYFEKKWIKLCGNGDVIEYREVPVKKYNDFRGDSGDYNEDYNDDYYKKTNFSNHEIVTKVFESKKCALKVKPCGCPIDSVENENLVSAHCPEYINPCSPCGRKLCNTASDEINSDCVGEVNTGECGTRIYVRGLRKPASHLLLQYQTNGRSANSETTIPEYCLMALWTGMEYRAKMFNNTISIIAIEYLRQRHEAEKNNLIMFQNPMDLKFVSNLQDAERKW